MTLAAEERELCAHRCTKTRWRETARPRERELRPKTRGGGTGLQGKTESAAVTPAFLQEASFEGCFTDASRARGSRESVPGASPSRSGSKDL